MKIVLDAKGFVIGLTYYGMVPIPFKNYKSLYGVHEKYLNRLIARFDEGIITDFIQYPLKTNARFFNETWALPIFHDTFQSFIKDMRQQVVSHYAKETTPLIDEIRDKLLNEELIPENQKLQLYKSFDSSKARKGFDDKAFTYLISTGAFDSFP